METQQEHRVVLTEDSTGRLVRCEEMEARFVGGELDGIFLRLKVVREGDHLMVLENTYAMNMREPVYLP